MRVQRLEAFERRHRHHEVAAREADQPLDLALVVALARPAEAILEQVVRLQLGEHARALPLAVAQNARHRDLGVVVEDRLRHAAEERERLHVPVAERLRRLCRVGHHEDGVRVRQVQREEVDLALHATDDPDRLAEVGLGMPRRMHQRHEHLLRPLPPARHVVLHDRDAAREAVLVAQPLEDPLRRVLLLLGNAFVVSQDLVDDRDERIELRPHRRLRAHVARRHRELHHLADSPGIDPEPPRRRPLAQTLDLNRVSNLRVELHVLHPPPSAERGTGLPVAGILLRRNRPNRLLH